MNEAAEHDRAIRRLMQQGRMRDAAAACDQLNQRYPEYVPGWVTATDLALSVNEPEIAARANARALQLTPGQPALLLQRVECLMASGDHHGAIELAGQLRGITFDTASGASAFGLLLSRLQLYAQASEQFRRASQLEPDNGEHHYNLATVERFLGHGEEAEAAINHCLELRPDDADAQLLRSGLRVQTRERNNISQLLKAHEMTAGDERRRATVCYALAKELEDIGDYDRAFGFLREGASLRRKMMQYTPENDLAAMREIRRVYSRDLFAGHIDGHISAEPIFIIGMPRTGTTLVERILSGHSAVRSAGELPTFATELTRLCRDQAGQPASSTSDLVSQSVAIDFAALGERYVSKARPPGERTAHFVDKLPLNFLYAGLIHLALPKAKIILLERDPMDTCYAVYKAMFRAVYPFSYDLEELANYFVEYRRLMNHWQEVMPGAMHVVSYEKLVTEPEAEIAALLQYCDLSFEEGCRRFFENPDASTTASADSVRRDFFTSSIGKWRNYEEQLQPVSDILESVS
jgi:tetratricopeptide (TPR) repeat protein